VTGTLAGTVTDQTSGVVSTEGGLGAASNIARLLVATPGAPTVTKTFSPTTILTGATSTLTVTIANPNAFALTGVAFTDTLAAGLVVSTPNAPSNTCGGTATAVAGSGTVSLTGGTIAASGSCTVSVSVTGTTAGPKVNSLTVTSAQAAAGTAPTATLT